MTTQTSTTVDKSTATNKRKRKKTAPKTFQAAFTLLKNNANDLQQQTEPDIDNLMTIVEESIAAYKVCQHRIDAVQQALDAAFANDALPEDEG